jgi:antirestriction protein ArdC
MSRTSKAARATTGRDLYAEVTAKLLAAIERDPGKPQMPWRRAGAPLWMPVNALTGSLYRGVNVVSLWVTAEERSYTHPIFATYKQWQELGAQVKKGEKSALVIKYGEYEVDPDPDRGDDDGKRVYAKAAHVFNCAQVDGFVPPALPEMLGPVERIDNVAHFIANTGARIEIGGDRAYYRPSTDTVHMPEEGLFVGTDSMSRSESWHATEAHEVVHWTSHKDRCARELGRRFGDKAYCAEELVAEIGSAMLCAELGVSQDVRADHAQYLAQWLELMKADSKAIFTAAAAAGKAVDYLKSLQPQPDPSPPLVPEPEPQAPNQPARRPNGIASTRAARG